MSRIVAYSLLLNLYFVAIVFAVALNNSFYVSAVFACAPGLCKCREREQETAWVCQATGQESQDKGKETQMEVQGLKLSYIPKNAHQCGL